MKKLSFLALFVLLSIVCFGQLQKYISYKQIYTEKSFTESFDDTCKVVIQDDTKSRLIIISGKNVMEFLVSYDVKDENIGSTGLKSVLYTCKEGGIPLKVEFLYNHGILRQISIIRINTISCFIIELSNINEI